MVPRLAGAVLAGGAGRRMGGEKHLAPLGGRPLFLWPLAALSAVCPRVAVVCKPDTRLPELPPGAERWDEPREPPSPTGIVHAVERAHGRVLVCAADMPWVTPAALSLLLEAADRSGGEEPRAVVAEADGRLEPTLAVYAPAALAVLRTAPAGSPLTRTVEALGPLRVTIAADVVRGLNAPADLALAEAELAARRPQRDASSRALRGGRVARRRA